MAPVLVENRDRIADVCRRHGVRRLDLFGSAARSGHDLLARDVDFFYEFDAADPRSVADRYFGLQEDLRALLGCEVDLVSSKYTTNPYFLEVANGDRQAIYAADGA